MLRELASFCFSATSQSSFFQAVTTSLSHSPYDVPFAMLYNSESSPSECLPMSFLEQSSREEALQETLLEIPPTLLPRTLSSDLPISFSFALARRSRTTSSSTISSKSDVKFSLVGSVGPPSDHSSAPSSLVLAIDFSTGIAEDVFSTCPWPIAEAVSTREPVFVADCRDLAEGFESRGWGETESAIVIPREFED